MKQILTIIIVLSCLYSNAQEMLGIVNSNYAGVNGLSLNPSNMVDNRLRIDVNLLTFGISADNDFLFYPKDSLKFFGFKRLVDLTENKGYLDKYFSNSSTKQYNAGIYVLVKGPSAMFHLEKNWFAIQTQIRGVATLADVAGSMGKFGYEDEGLKFDPLHNQLFDEDGFKIGAMLWSEINASYGREIYNKDKNYVKGGLTLKFLSGYASGYALGKGMTYNVLSDSVMQINNADVTYGHSFDEYIKGTRYTDLINGRGIGVDLGFAYEYRPDYEETMYEMDGQRIEDPMRNHYKLKVGLSFLDLGKIQFDKDARDFDMRGRSSLWVGYDTINTINTIDFDTTISNYFYGNPDASLKANKYNMSLPHALSLQVDYNLYKTLYANATVIQRIDSKDKPGVTAANLVSITPRVEMDWFEVAIPLSFYQYTRFRAGLALRLGSFIIGSDKLGSLFGLADLGGMDVYTSLKFSLPRKKIKDRDGDGVSDAKDNCINERGEWATMGCPDRDKDGIMDKDDACPDVKGIARFQGCPDTDNDGIPDKEDDCPEVAGILQFKGCPDTDGDGIPDKLDACPTEAGLEKFDGCPDTDEDGIPDRLDSCKTEKGLAQFNGCPDTDGDGLMDKEDECPLVAGPISNKGCPVVQKVEIKPKEPVKVELTQEEQEVINKVFKNLEFETGKWIIRQTSFASLIELSELLKKKPNFKLLIDGHTDNVGAAAYNLKLSQNRANAVKTYLVDKGIQADRITAKGYGLTKPIAPNTTPEGRQKNRRVEFTIVE